jgi:hypothetical protein
MSDDVAGLTLAELADALDIRLRSILSDEQYALFVAFSERRRRLPDATANAHEMLALRIVNNDAEVRRLRDAIRATLGRAGQ